jgi:prolyl-tRNA synthetase
VDYADADQKKAADSLYASLVAEGVEVLLDDRNERAGVKFKDADLIGIPIRVNIGPKFLKENKMEIKLRKSGDVIVKEIPEIVQTVLATRKKMMEELRP